MYTLGINAAFHDSAACLVRDGEILAAAEEERFSHIKHGKRPLPFSAYELPFNAIDYCLSVDDIGLQDIDHVAYSFNPLIQLGKLNGHETMTLPLEPTAHPVPSEWEAAWDPLFLSSIVNAPRHLAGGAPHHLQRRFAKHKESLTWHFVDHHVAHAASAFLPSPFEEAAIMTLDGRGERATTWYGRGQASTLEQIGEVNMPHSLGLLYERFTSHLGFLHSSDEYKVMALASFGKPKYVNEFRDIVKLGVNGQYSVELGEISETFGPARVRGGPLEQRHYDITRSLQVVLEEAVLHIADWLHTETRMDAVCMAGGVALNCVLTARLRDDGPFSEVWVQPASGDAGTALGAAAYVDARHAGSRTRRHVMDNVYLGPCYEDEEIESFLAWTKIPYLRSSDLARDVARILAEDKIVGWFQGRMEFGPRALGARSILASPLNADMQRRLNQIKDREDFRPVAPVVLEEEADAWFRNAGHSPFMVFVHDVLPEVADRIPAVQHVDGTARIQTINRNQNPLYYDLLKRFEELTEVPILVNTSFNTRSEPIVCSPRDAIECFWASPLDALAIGPFLLQKPDRGA